MKLYANYYNAKEQAKKEKLQEAEYGDVYGTNYSYVQYNKSGDREDDPEIICYYTWKTEVVKTKDGQYTHAIPSYDIDEGVIRELKRDYGQSVEDEEEL